MRENDDRLARGLQALAELGVADDCGLHGAPEAAGDEEVGGLLDVILGVSMQLRGLLAPEGGEGRIVDWGSGIISKCDGRVGWGLVRRIASGQRMGLISDRLKMGRASGAGDRAKRTAVVIRDAEGVGCQEWDRWRITATHLCSAWAWRVRYTRFSVALAIESSRASIRQELRAFLEAASRCLGEKVEAKSKRAFAAEGELEAYYDASHL